MAEEILLLIKKEEEEIKRVSVLQKFFALFNSLNFKDKISKGKKGENLALNYLKGNGYEIVERNFRVKGGEADLITKKDEKVIVVEVKFRTSEKFGSPQSAITKRKFRRLLRAGTIYCRKKGYSAKSLQIDVISILMKNKEPIIRHFKNINLK